MRSPHLVRSLVSLALGLAIGAAAAAFSGGSAPHAEAAPLRPHHTVRHKLRHTPAPVSTFTLVAGGDMALAGEADASVLSGVARFLHGDVVAANLEGTLASGGSPRCTPDPKKGCYVFRASPGWAAALAHAGFTDLNVANNHALDYGSEGQSETLAALRAARLAHDGLPGQVAIVRAGGLKIALIGCAPYRWAQELLDTAGTAQLVHLAARRADVVVVYMHAGAEGRDAGHVSGGDESYLGERRGNPLAFAHAMVDAGADLVFASGPHVLRGMEWYRGRLIAYSLGNLAGVHTLATVGSEVESALLRVTLDGHGRFVRGNVVPLRLEGGGTPAFDPARTSIGTIAELSRADFGAHAVRLSPSGTLLKI